MEVYMKNKVLIKKLVIACFVIILIELIIMLIIKISRDRSLVNYDSLNDIIGFNENYVGVGSSDFSNSSYVNKKIYEYKNQRLLVSQAKIAKYDKNFNLLLEKSYDNLYDSVFSSILKTDDGFIAVGYQTTKKEQLGTRPQLLTSLSYFLYNLN